MDLQKKTTVQYIRVSSINKKNTLQQICGVYHRQITEYICHPRASYCRITRDSSLRVKQRERIQLITHPTLLRNRECVELYFHSLICLHDVHPDKCTAYNKPIKNNIITDAYGSVFHTAALFFSLKTWTTLNFCYMLKVLNIYIHTYTHTHTRTHAYKTCLLLYIWSAVP